MRIKSDFEMSLGVVSQTVLGSKTACGTCNKQLAIGIMVEMEHTKDPKEAEKIARDHLAEDPKYYTNAMDENWGIDEAKDRANELSKKTAQSVAGIWQPGTKVRFAKPMPDEDANCIMIVKEDRGDRVLVQDTGFDDWTIQPTSVYPKDDLVVVEQPNKTAMSELGQFQEVSENPWMWVNRTNRELSSGTLAGVIDQIDFRLGRPKTPPDRSAVFDVASAYANQAVEKSPHQDFGEKSDQMRRDVTNTIVDGYFKEMAARQRWTNSKQASVLVVDDDPEHIRIFRTAFGCDKTVVAKDAGAAIGMLRSMKFDKVFLERDLSSPNSTGEDIAWAMQKERLCPQARVIIHSENKRGQKVMARYIGQYHNDVSVVPFRELRKNLEKPRG